MPYTRPLSPQPSVRAAMHAQPGTVPLAATQVISGHMQHAICPAICRKTGHGRGRCGNGTHEYISILQEAASLVCRDPFLSSGYAKIFLI
ncbi:hypothetical protein Gxy13693_017_040 [Komagataeibacter xylinus NBRC 13693]|uniref:Uncharacterized protein n=1 Tax=Komagataeibacter xylinus NBRC 13693 TaxID=1234668 RepID=A0A0D6Q6H0_KOMXY|nr:hypothetical protein Gxy13693_017_040 [Komagataeibacter xylinus NBRC 13693]